MEIVKIYLKKLLVILCVFLFYSEAYAQVTFEKLYTGHDRESANDLIIDKNGGYTLAGWTVSFGPGYKAFYIIRTNEFGDTLWTSAYGGNKEDIAHAITQVDDGYVLVGSTTSFGEGEEDFFMGKIDNNGKEVWSTTFGGTGSDIARDVIPTLDGGFIIAGYTNSPGAKFFDMLLIKTDAEGNEEWRKMYGDMGFDNSRGIQQLSDGSYMVCGQNGNNNGDVWLLKLDADGNKLWEKFYGTSGTDEGKYVHQTGDGGFILIGDEDVYGSNQSDILIVKTDSKGDSLWTKRYGGVEKESGKTIRPTSDGGYIVAGISRSFNEAVKPDAWLIKIDANGEMLWERLYGQKDEHDHCHTALETEDGGIVFTAHTDEKIKGNKWDVWMMKLNNEGKLHSGKATDVALTSLENPKNEYCGKKRTPLAIELENNGADTIASVPITVRLSGDLDTLLQEVVSVNLAPGAIKTTYLEATFDAFNGGSFDILAYISVSGDSIAKNDTVNAAITLNPGIIAPEVTSGTRCGPGQVELIASADGNVFWYDSEKGNTPLDTGAVFVTPEITGTTTYYASTGDNTCESDRVPVEAVIFENPSIDMGGDTLVSGASIVLDAGDGFAVYSWSDGSMSQTITVSETGSYSVTVTNKNGCTASDEITVDFSTGFADNGNVRALAIYPNPTEGILQLKINASGLSHTGIKIMNITGQIVHEQAVPDQTGIYETSFDLTELPKGTYFIGIRSEQYKTTTKVLLH